MYTAGRLDPDFSVLYFLLFIVGMNILVLEMLVALIVEQSQLSEKRREALQFEQYVRGMSNDALENQEAPLGYAKAVTLKYDKLREAHKSLTLIS